MAGDGGGVSAVFYVLSWMRMSYSVPPFIVPRGVLGYRV